MEKIHLKGIGINQIHTHKMFLSSHGKAMKLHDNAHLWTTF